MKVQLRLTDEDRKRFDAPEWMDLDVDVVSFVEVITMQKGFQVGDEVVAFDSADGWRAAWYGKPVLDADGKPVMVTVVDEAGEPVIDEETGEPQTVERRVGDWGAVLVTVWLALRRSGIHRPIAEVAECDPEHIEYKVLDADESGPGKDGSGPGTTS